MHSLALPRPLRLYLWGNLHLALGAGLCTWAVRAGALGRPVVPGLLAWVILLGTVAVYGLDRLAGAAPSGPRGDWFQRHRRPMWALSLACGAGGAGLALALDVREQAWLAAGALLALGYALPVLRWRGRWQPLGAFLWARPWLVALVWTLATATAPLHAAGAPLFDGPGVQWQLGRFLLLAALVIPFDVRDRELDQARGVSTLATVLGERRALRVAVLLAAGAVAAALWPALQPEALVPALAAVALLAATHPQRGALWRLLLIDGILHLAALGVLVRWLWG